MALRNPELHARNDDDDRTDRQRVMHNAASYERAAKNKYKQLETNSDNLQISLLRVLRNVEEAFRAAAAHVTLFHMGRFTG